jgi:hypothetical protein
MYSFAYAWQDQLINLENIYFYFFVNFYLITIYSDINFYSITQIVFVHFTLLCSVVWFINVPSSKVYYRQLHTRRHTICLIA